MGQIGVVKTKMETTPVFFDSLLSEAITTPDRTRVAERRFLVAVLQQAFQDLADYQQRTDVNARRIYDAAWLWVFDTTQGAGEDHLSFGQTCDLLGLEASYVRRLARRLVHTPDAGRPHAA